MRVAIFFISLFSLLLARGNAAYAATGHIDFFNTASQMLSQSDQTKFAASDLGNILIEDSDLDVEDDLFSSNDVNISNKFLLAKYPVPVKWYLTDASIPYLRFNDKGFHAFQPFSGNSSPIYIKQRVLRI